MLRIFLFFLCLYIFYLLFFSKRDPKKGKKQKFRVFHGGPPPPSEEQNLIVDEMKRCPSCGTFNPKSHAVKFQGEYFCNEECREKRV